MLLFTRLTKQEKAIIRRVWRWNDEEKPDSGMPSVKKDTLDGLIAKLWHLESKYQSAVKEVEEVIDDIEGIEDNESVEQSETQKESLHRGIKKLDQIIELLEWLRSNETERTFSPI